MTNPFKPNLNRFQVIGKLKSDPILKVTSNEKKIVELIIKIEDSFKKNMQNVTTQSSIAVTLFNFAADYALSLHKESLVYCEGVLRNNEWIYESKNYSKLELICLKIFLLNEDKIINQGNVINNLNDLNDDIPF